MYVATSHCGAPLALPIPVSWRNITLGFADAWVSFHRQ